MTPSGRGGRSSTLGRCRTLVHRCTCAITSGLIPNCYAGYRDVEVPAPAPHEDYKGNSYTRMYINTVGFGRRLRPSNIAGCLIQLQSAGVAVRGTHPRPPPLHASKHPGSLIIPRRPLSSAPLILSRYHIRPLSTSSKPPGAIIRHTYHEPTSSIPN
jgi:hypothetical protein